MVRPTDHADLPYFSWDETGVAGGAGVGKGPLPIRPAQPQTEEHRCGQGVWLKQHRQPPYASPPEAQDSASAHFLGIHAYMGAQQQYSVLVRGRPVVPFRTARTIRSANAGTPATGCYSVSRSNRLVVTSITTPIVVLTQHGLRPVV